MNTTGVVGYIALLMIVGASLGGGSSDRVYATSRADAYSARNQAEVQFKDGSSSLFSPKGQGRYVRILIEGRAYQGTLHLEE